MRLFNGITGEVIREDTDPHWTDVIDGTPAQLRNGHIVWTELSDDTRRLIVAPAADLATAAPLTPPGLQVRDILGTDGDSVLFSGSTEPTEIGVWRYGPDGLTAVATDPGVHTAQAAGSTTVVSGWTLRGNHVSVRINRKGKTDRRHRRPRGGTEPAAPRSAVPRRRGRRHPHRGALPVLAPAGHEAAGADGPVRRPAFAARAEDVQRLPRLAVVRGTGLRRRRRGRSRHAGPRAAWDRMVAGDFATGVLEDQVTALHAAAEKFADLDASRTGIRGWSFGGYLAALAVLRRPDVFGAAVAGAPVTDWRLYDTHYTERYLGDPAANPAAYEVSSLNDDPERAVATAVRPLLIIHGLADDNVFVAHSLRLSSALLAAGYPHSVLPLSGVTHMTPQEVVAENLLLLQVAFLRDALSRQGV